MPGILGPYIEPLCHFVAVTHRCIKGDFTAREDVSGYLSSLSLLTKKRATDKADREPA